MPYQIRMAEIDPETQRPRNLRVGDMYFAPWQLEREYAEMLAPNFIRDWLGKRPPLVVVLPDGSRFNVDGRAFGKINPGKERQEQFGYYGDGWKITGEAPLITVAPSIHIPGYYHGFIRAGIILDDIEGRAALHAQRWAESPEGEQ